MVLDAARSGDAPAIAVRRIGPALLFERLWQETGCQDVIAGLARKRGHHFAVERAVFLTVLHRLMRGCAVGSRGLPKLYAISHEVPPECQGETRTNQWPRDRYISAVVPRRTVDWDTP